MGEAFTFLKRGWSSFAHLSVVSRQEKGRSHDEEKDAQNGQVPYRWSQGWFSASCRIDSKVGTKIRSSIEITSDLLF